MSHNATLRAGIAYGIGGFGIWGTAPIYWHALKAAGPWEVMVYRIVGTALLAAVVLALRHRFVGLGRSIKEKSVQRDLLLSSLLIGGNWACYVWAVMAGRILEASLGYYLCPLVSIALGVFLLKEPITRAKLVAIALAGAGVGALMIGLGVLPWVPLFLAISFGLYGFVRKRVAVEAMEGVFIETLIWMVPSFVLLWFLPNTGRHTSVEWSLLLLAGAFTLLPLVFYTESARRVRLTTLGFLQYIAPTLQLLCAVLLYNETVTRAHVFAFAAIWLGIAIFTWDSLRRMRAPVKPAEAVT